MSIEPSEGQDTEYLLNFRLRSPSQVQERLDRLIRNIKEIQEPFLHGGTASDVLIVAHGHILRAFTKRWMGKYRFPFISDSTDTWTEWDIKFPFTMMMEPGAIGVLSYAHHSIDEPALLIGMAFPSTD